MQQPSRQNHASSAAPPTPLVLSLATRITDMIRTQGYATGDKLAAQALADQFQVSRSPVRAALMYLAERGLIERIPNKGFAVKRLPDATLEQNQPLPDEGSAPYHRLAQDWLSDRLPSEVSEQMLREHYHLTRGQLNDVLLRAVREGWAERKEGYGWRLLPVAKTPESFEQIYRFRMLIEPAGLLEPTFHADPIVLAELRRVQERMLERDIEVLPAEHLLENGAGFHEELMRLSGNPFLHMALVRVNRMRRLLEYRAPIDRERFVVQCTDHIRILATLEKGAIAEASAMMREHLGGALERKSPVRWTENS